jgi:hypothetical protein
MPAARVVFIAGSGRSGSTLLHNMLAQVDGLFGVGEVMEVWRRGVLHGKRCGCGERFSKCAVWTTVLRDAVGDRDSVDAAQLAALTDSFRTRHLPSVFVQTMRRRRLRRLEEYLDVLRKLYLAIASTTDGRVIVDSSKNPAYAYLLTQLADVQVSVIHLVRDPRAVAFSWSRTKLYQADDASRDLMPRKTAFESAMVWNSRNIGTELVKPYAERYTRVRYEDVAAGPASAVRSILRWLGEHDGDVSFVDGDVVRFDRSNHSVFGNPVRFDRGAVTVSRDEEWRRTMSAREQKIVTATTWPLQIRYGYN